MPEGIYNPKPSPDACVKGADSGPGVNPDGTPKNLKAQPPGPKPTHDASLADVNDGPGVNPDGTPKNLKAQQPDINRPTSDKDQDPNNGPAFATPKPEVGPGV